MTDPETTGSGVESDNPEAAEVIETVVGPGAALREARERLGLDVGKVARSLKVDERIVAALDGERYGELPALVYTRGYVRRYAGLVGLDADTLCVELDALQRDDPEVVRMSGSSRSALASGLFREHAGTLFGGVVFLVVVAIVAAVWIAWRSENDPVEDVPATSLFPSEALPALAEGDETTNRAAVETAPTGQTAVADAQTTTAEGDDAAEVNPLAGPAVVGDELGFLFSDDCWVEVRGGDGELLHMDLERAGNTLTVSGDAPFAIILGYAPGVRLTYNGDPVALGPHTRNRKAELVLGH